jgi:hypothetical protein
MRIELTPYQYDFIYSKTRHPAFVGGWGTGKTLSAISRAVLYSKAIPENLGIIFRKTFKSLQDSTLRDFEKYTGLKVTSERNYTFENKSTIMFRHLDEIESINQQNINLGWFYIEQGEELENDKQFWMLWGRLRRGLVPSESFNMLGLPQHSGWVIANAGDNWIKRLWKDKMLVDSAKELSESYSKPGEVDLYANYAELIEATTWDNEKNLSPQFIASLRMIEKNKPEMYRQYVMNDWSVDTDQFAVISRALITSCKDVVPEVLPIRKIVAVDPATGGDECVIYYMENYEIKDTMILKIKDTMKIVGEVMVFASKHSCKNFAIDSIGIGKGIADRLIELGKNVLSIQSAESARNNQKFNNRRTEMWWTAFEMFQDRLIPMPTDQLLIDQLTAVRYQVVNSDGAIKLEPKEYTKKRLGSSPDRADAYIYGLWGIKNLNKIENKRVFEVAEARLY